MPLAAPVRKSSPAAKHGTPPPALAAGFARHEEDHEALHPPAPGGCACGGDCPRCRAAADARLSAAVAPVLAERGAPLESATRQDMERHFARDFSAVRIHDGPAAHSATHALGAEAFAAGSDVVFAPDRFRPREPEGRHLLAHELAHVAQHRNFTGEAPAEVGPANSAEEHEADAAATAAAAARPVPTLTRAAAGIHLQRPTPRATPARITDVDVDQTTPQTVTVTWSDGHSDHDICSTGKGHCCVDDPTSEGGSASVAGSRANGSNCTPIGNFRITAKVPETGGHVKLWNQFEDARSIALHEYDPVDGTPLSHGCVRLHHDMAQRIFDHAPVGTPVHVRNFARPECSHAALVNEWANDFMTAGWTPPDGDATGDLLGFPSTPADIARDRHNAAEERRDLRAALGVDDAGLDQAIGATRQGLDNATVQARIPRCVARRTAEEAKVPQAISAGLGPASPAALTTFTRALGRADSLRTARTLVRRAGETLWTDATHRAQDTPADTDDRTLYWSRLQMTEAIRAWEPAWNRAHSPDVTRRAQQEMLDLLESTSRGRESATFDADPDLKHILISGFDPFGFAGGGDIHQGNPSGAIALALDNQLLTANQGGVQGRVQSVILPVRFADFDAGTVESLFRPYLNGARLTNLIMTISMGASSDYELENYAGRRRSSLFPDNTGRVGNPTGATPPPEIPGTGPGTEFIRTNMLAQSGRTLTPSPALVAMRRSLGRTGPITGERAVDEIRPGATAASHSDTGPTDPGSLAVTGSGGGYLSNEIFYRVSNLRVQTGATVPVIHLHTPLLDENATATQRTQVIATARGILEAALPNI